MHCYYFWPGQLQVDHIDGNHDNNEPENLQTLCANCHAVKTNMYRDWEDKKNKLFNNTAPATTLITYLGTRKRINLRTRIERC